MIATSPYKIAIVGLGKIAIDQHVPSIASNADFELAATVSRNASLEGVPSYTDIDTMLEERPDIDCVALCMPPQVRYEFAVKALKAKRNVLLEKPPGATLSEVDELISLAETQDVCLFATWHSRFASAVDFTKDAISQSYIQKLEIVWKEDVRKWHPGQGWIWEAGGVGVFDPGINALSIMTEILPFPVHLKSAILEFPANRDTPIAASLDFNALNNASVTAVFDWRQEGKQSWDIFIKSNLGEHSLLDGGSRLLLDGKLIFSENEREYENIYTRFSRLLKSGKSDIDIAPFKHVADAFMLGRRIEVSPFED